MKAEEEGSPSPPPQDVFSSLFSLFLSLFSASNMRNDSKNRIRQRRELRPDEKFFSRKMRAANGKEKYGDSSSAPLFFTALSVFSAHPSAAV